jgi:signal transduction histidine kinase
MNILGNAVKYTPEGRSIAVTTTSSADEFLINIRDTGIGIPEAELPRIFEKFYRCAATQEVQGSGVGLATALQAIRLHGGDIRVTSKVGEGTQFSIVIPRTLINTSIGE